MPAAVRLCEEQDLTTPAHDASGLRRACRILLPALEACSMINHDRCWASSVCELWHLDPAAPETLLWTWGRRLPRILARLLRNGTLPCPRARKHSLSPRPGQGCWLSDAPSRSPLTHAPPNPAACRCSLARLFVIPEPTHTTASVDVFTVGGCQSSKMRIWAVD